MGQITIFDVIKFSVPLYCGHEAALLAVHHFGPYYPMSQHPPHVHNVDGHSPMFYGAIGFVGGCSLVFGLWKCFIWFLGHLDRKRRQRDGFGIDPDS